MNSDMQFEVVPVDMAKAGFGAQYKSMAPGFEGTDGNTYLIDVNPNYIFDDVDAMRMMVQSWVREIERPDHRHRKGIYFFGPTGSGKTSFVEQFFARLKVPLVRTTWNPKREADEMVSTQTLIDGDLMPKDQAIAIAARIGCPCLINEVDLGDPGELTSLNDIVEKGLITLPSGQTIKAKRGFMVFCTANTAGQDDESGTYHGTRSQNAAFLRRFFHVELGYPSYEAELDFLKMNFPDAGEAILESAAKVAIKIRQAYEGTADKLRLMSPISRPELLDWVDMVFRFAGLKDKGKNVAVYAMNFCFAARLGSADQETVASIVENCFGDGE